MLVDGFDVRPSHADESIEAPPREAALRLARRKAESTRPSSDEVVVAADTVVSLDRRRYEKAADAEEARSFLSALDGQTHSVHTGVAVADADGLDALVASAKLRFRLGARLEEYVASGLWQGKAGAYGLQDALVAANSRLLEGRPSTVWGLPLEETARLLRRHGVEVMPFDPAHNPFSGVGQ